MTQRLSSFYLYLVDLWRRCFAKEYWVKAGGNSETKHDFRICPECGVRVISLNPCWRVERCENEACIAILHKKGEYIRKERQFHLEKPLYSTFFAGLYIIISVCALTCLAILRLRIVPDGYEPMWWNGLPAYLLAISVFFYADTHIF